MSNSKLSVSFTGKYIDFKREEYSIMMTRIDAINSVMTEKCKSLSLKPLEKNFSFDFVFRGIDNYLFKIEEYDKKQRKDDLKKWWMNQKASEMAKDCLPSILDRMDQISLTIAKQERSELLRNKFEKYIKFELLECALKSSFRRPRASSANVFPNTSFQYARSRLRRKLENVYFNEIELKDFISSNKKKKEEWIKLIEIKRNKYKDEYHRDKLKKQKQKKKHHHHHHHHHHHKRHRMKKTEENNDDNDNRTMSISMSSSIQSIQSMPESVCSSTGGSSDQPIVPMPTDNIINIPLIIPPPPPLNELELKDDNNNNMLPPALNMKMPHIDSKKPSGYCSQCTSYAIQLSKLTKELHSFKISLGETQMQLNHITQQVNHWKKKYKDKCNLLKQYECLDVNINYKQKYDKKAMELQQLQSQIGLLIAGNNTINTTTATITNSNNSIAPTIIGGIITANNNINNNNNNNNNNNIQLIAPSTPQRIRQDSTITNSSTSRQRHNSQEMSFQSSEFSVNAQSDKMSISGNSSLNPYNYFRPENTVISGFPAINPMPSIGGDQNQAMSQIITHHLKHNSNSTEKMLQRLQSENSKNSQNAENSNSGSQSFLCEEAENILFPIDNNNNNNNKNKINNVHNGDLLDVPQPMTVNVNNNNNHSQSVASQATTHSTFSGNGNNNNNNNNIGNYSNTNYNIPETDISGHHQQRNNQHVRSYDHINNVSLNGIIPPKINENNGNNGNNVFAVNGVNIDSNLQIINHQYWDHNGTPKTNNVSTFTPRDRNMSLSSNNNNNNNNNIHDNTDNNNDIIINPNPSFPANVQYNTNINNQTNQNQFIYSNNNQNINI